MEPCVQIFPLNNQVDGKPVFQVVLFQQHASVSLLTIGATLQHFQIQVNGFEKRDVVLGYPDWQSYKTAFDSNQSAYYTAELIALLTTTGQSKKRAKILTPL